MLARRESNKRVDKLAMAGIGQTEAAGLLPHQEKLCRALMAEYRKGLAAVSGSGDELDESALEWMVQLEEAPHQLLETLGGHDLSTSLLPPNSAVECELFGMIEAAKQILAHDPEGPLPMGLVTDLTVRLMRFNAQLQPVFLGPEA